MRFSGTEYLRQLLIDARNCIPDGEFCGMGVVLYADATSLPVLGLCPEKFVPRTAHLAEHLAQASLLSNPCHDGFHLVSTNFELTHTNQYFAPPIPPGKAMPVFPVRYCGARYMSAKIGSLLPSVSCAGIVSDRDGLVIFKNGREFE